jgi:hypothetical protein
LYNRGIYKNRNKLADSLKNKEIVFLNLFSPLSSPDILDVPDRVYYYGKIKIELLKDIHKKQGYDAYSNLNSIGDIVNRIEKELWMHNRDAINDTITKDITNNKIISENRTSNIVYIPTGPVLSFGLYNERLDGIYNSIEILINKNIIREINKELGKRKKAILNNGDLLKKIKGNLYQANPSLYDGDLSIKLEALEKGKIRESEKEQIRAIANYNKWLTAIMFSKIMQSTEQDVFYYFGTKNSPSYTIIKKASEMCGKKIIDVNLVENIRAPLNGVSSKSSANKLMGFVYSLNHDPQKITFGEFFRNGKYKEFM